MGVSTTSSVFSPTLVYESLPSSLAVNLASSASRSMDAQRRASGELNMESGRKK